MAIKRIIYELDDATDLNPTTGASINKTSLDKNFIKNQTKTIDDYSESENSNSDKSTKNNNLIGRTVSDLVAEFKNDSRVMTVIITIISFLIFVNKLDTVASFLFPILLSLLLNLLWFSIPYIEKKFIKK